MPDLLCLSKGLTGGFLPLAAVLATQDDLRRLPRRFARTRVPAFAQLHRQSAGLRGGAGVAGDLRQRRRARAQPRDGARRWPRWRRRFAAHRARRRRAPGRDDRRLRTDRRTATSARRSTRRSASACAPIARRWSTAWCCVRSATCCTGCRRTASTTTQLRLLARDHRAHRHRRGHRLMRMTRVPRRPAAADRRATSRCPKSPPPIWCACCACARATHACCSTATATTTARACCRRGQARASQARSRLDAPRSTTNRRCASRCCRASRAARRWT